jgi:hypothetical protein
MMMRKFDNRYITGGAILLLVIVGILWNMNSGKIVQAAKDLLIKQADQMLNGGRVETGDVEFSLWGQVVIKKVAVYDHTNKVVASCDQVGVGFSLPDLLSGNLDLSVVKTVTLTTPQLMVIEDQNGNFNLATLLKPSSETKQPFRGVIKVENGICNFTYPEGSRQLNKIAGTLDFSSYPVIQCKDMVAFLAEQKVVAAGQIDASGQDIKTKFSISSASFDPSAASPDIPMKGVTSFKADTDGTLANPVAKGTFEVPQGMFVSIPFANASGGFRYADGIITIDNLQASVYGGSVTLRGTFNPKNIAYNLNIVGDGIDASQVSENKVQSRVNFSCDVNGVANFDSAYAQGSFNLSSGTINGIAFSSTNGLFRKQGTAYSIYDVVIYTGVVQLKAEGTVDGNTVKFNILPVDPTAAVEKAIQGATPSNPLDKLRKSFP